jgi:hypothetical protein
MNRDNKKTLNDYGNGPAYPNAASPAAITNIAGVTYHFSDSKQYKALKMKIRAERKERKILTPS